MFRIYLTIKLGIRWALPQSNIIKYNVAFIKKCHTMPSCSNSTKSKKMYPQTDYSSSSCKDILHLKTFQRHLSSFRAKHLQQLWFGVKCHTPAVYDANQNSTGLLLSLYCKLTPVASRHATPCNISGQAFFFSHRWHASTIQKIWNCITFAPLSFCMPHLLGI